MSKGGSTFTVAWIRRGVQIVFLLVFFALLLMARPQLGESPSPVAQASFPLVKLFFWFDPLILLATWLAAHAIPAAALLALVVIAVTVVLGRVFCGWACPLGTIHDVTGRALDRWQDRRKRGDHWSPWQRTKYYVLVGLLVMAAFGGHWVCILDPLVLLYRTSTVALVPAAQWVVEQGSTAVYQADPGVGPLRLTSLTEPAYRYLRDHVFVMQKQAFLGTGLIVALFVAILALNAYRRRFWCRYLCPLGALLGLFSWRPALRRQVDPESCNHCDLCAMTCHGAAAEAPGHGWKPSECLGCFNCTPACNRAALSFNWTWPWRRKSRDQRLGLSRRAVLGAGLGGIAALSLLRANPQARQRRFEPRLIRPPGARPEPEFLQRCTGCGLCMKVCPTGGLQPAITEAGLEGLWTPRLVPRIGYCDYNCNLCGQVCPTQAIELLALEVKQETRLGLATFDTTRCIPYAYGRDCMVCEEHCPIPDKAIYFLEVEIEDREGGKKTIKQPHVDPELCIGCGVCENVCVFRDRPAIRISSSNETRNRANQPILPEDGLYF